MIVLGLDLQGTRLGWCLLDHRPSGQTVRAGVLPLGVRREPGARKNTTRQVVVPEMRFFDLRHFLADLLANEDRSGRPVDVVAYEQVIGHGRAGATAAHLWGAAEAAVLEVVHRHGLSVRPVELRRVGVSAGKLALGGNGAAGKPLLALRAAQRWGNSIDWSAGDYDAADAAGVALAVVQPGETRAARAKREAAERRAARGAA